LFLRLLRQRTTVLKDQNSHGQGQCGHHEFLVFEVACRSRVSGRSVNHRSSLVISRRRQPSAARARRSDERCAAPRPPPLAAPPRPARALLAACRWRRPTSEAAQPTSESRPPAAHPARRCSDCCCCCCCCRYRGPSVMAGTPWLPEAWRRTQAAGRGGVVAGATCASLRRVSLSQAHRSRP
jgi:hypothetical protein